MTASLSSNNSISSKKYELLAESSMVTNKSDSLGTQYALASYVYAGLRVTDKLVPYIRFDDIRYRDSEVYFSDHNIQSFIGGLRYELSYYSDVSVQILPAEMNSVFVKLLHNATYSLREKSSLDKDFKPELTIETSFYESHVEIKIRDNGKGISDVDKEQLFSPFFTTKPTSEGTGLGLFVSQDIIRAHNGSISVDTQQGLFTAFIIKLPIVNSCVL